MGCFSVTCVLSGISIYSQEAVYIPLQPAKYTRLNDKGQVPFEITDNYVSNDGAFGMFVPKYLPVFGQYDTIPVETLAKKLADLLHFAHTMFLCNRMFIPQMSGTQTGEYNIQKQMYQKAAKVCSAILNQYK